MSATALAVALRKPVIPFKPIIPHDSYTTVSLYHEMNIGTVARPVLTKRKEEAFHCSTNDIEYILRTIKEFNDVTAQDRLHLVTGPLRFTFFRKCLGGTVRDNWDIARQNINQDLAGFDTAIQTFKSKFLNETDFADQKHYLENFEKPHSLSPKTAADRLVQMNSYLGMMPGSGNANPWNDNAIKMRLFSMMRLEWQLNFTSGGHQLNDATMTYARLTEYFEGQHKVSTAKYQLSKSRAAVINDGTNDRPNKRPRLDFPSSTPCPYHKGSHIWHHCYGNPNGSNYRANFVLPQLPAGANHAPSTRRNPAPPGNTRPFQMGQPPSYRGSFRPNQGFRNDYRGPPHPNNHRPPNRGPTRNGNSYSRNGHGPPRNNGYQRRGQDGHFHDDQAHDQNYDYDQQQDGYDDHYYQDYPPQPHYDDSYNSRDQYHNQTPLPPPPPPQAPTEPNTPPPQSHTHEDQHWLDDYRW